MTEETMTLPSMTLKDRHEVLSYLMGRYAQTLDIDTKAKILYNVVIHMTPEEMGEAGIEESDLDEVMKDVFWRESTESWPNRVWVDGDKQYAYYLDGRKMRYQDHLKYQRNNYIENQFTTLKAMSKIAVKITDYLSSKNVTIPISIYGSPPQTGVGEK